MKYALILIAFGSVFTVNAILVRPVVPYPPSGPENAVRMDAGELVNELVEDDADVTFEITNASYSPVEANPIYSSIGLFSDATAESQGNESLLNGIVLSTGYATTLNNNANTSDGITGEIISSGDDDLNNLLDPGLITDDATVIEFDFTMNSEVDQLVSFSYMFGSDEYDEWANSSYNDIFGIFLDEENIATIPDTDIPVSINTINELHNSELYTSNDRDNEGGAHLATEIDGFTAPLTVEFFVEAGSTHHMKIAVADVGYGPFGDHINDSWILIGKDSWTCIPQPQPVPEPGTHLLLITGLSFLVFSFRNNFFRKR